MNLNFSVLVIVAIAVLAVLATTFRVSTAPERIRLRIEAAKSTCLGAGGEWVRVDGEEICRTAEERGAH